MIGHYGKTALKHLTHSKLFSVINILGLAVGLAASIIIFLYVQSEWSYDKHWEGAGNIYRLMQTEAGRAEIDVRVPAITIPAVQDYFGSEIAHTAVLRKASFAEVKVGTTTFVEDIAFVNEAFLDVFEFDTISGDINSVFQNANALALSEDSARLWYGETDVVGESLTLKEFFQEQGRDYDIVAVYRQPEGNSTLDVKAMGGLPENGDSAGGREVYLKLDPQVDPALVGDRLPQFVDQYADRTGVQVSDGQAVSDVLQYHLINVGDSYFDPIYCAAWNAAPCGSLPVVAGFAVIAALVLLTACVNYVVLALSKAGQRAREVAVRKIAGAPRRQLIMQFLGESLVILMLSLILALTLVDLVLPLFENLTRAQLSLNFDRPGTFLILLGLALTLSLLAGLYPSLYISRFHPAVILRNRRPPVVKDFSHLHGSLLVFQFSTSIGLLIATVVVFGQLWYTQTLDLGFNPDNLIQVPVGRPEANARAQAFRQEVLNSPLVDSAALTGMSPGESGVVVSDEYKARGLLGAEPRSIPTIPVGFDFFETLETPLVAGRFFQSGRDRPGPAFRGGQEQRQEGAVVLNEAAVKLLGFSSPEEAINQTISSEVEGLEPGGSGERLLRVVGIVSDSQYRSLQRVAGPEVFFLNPEMAFFLLVRFNGEGQTVIAELERIWHEIMGDAAFQSSFISGNLASVFQNERDQGVLLVTFALLSIFISCLGLYGVAAFTVDRRRKEIAIRKVFGSEFRQVAVLFCWQFSSPILLANIIAWPVAVWAMLAWLQRFPYQFDTLLLFPLCALAAFIALSIAWLTVAVNTAKVANSKPGLALRCE